MAHSHVAIVGDGPASLALLAVLREAGLARGAVTIYGDNLHPLATLEKYANAVNQKTMRSEGDGHLHPRNFPDLTWRDAWQRKSLKPFVLNLFNLYNPPLKLVLDHTEKVAAEFEFEAHREKIRLGCVRRARSSSREFDLMDADGQYAGRARHVVLALGYPGLNWPGKFKKWQGDPRVRHVYERPTVLPGERVVIVGGGIAAVHMWLAALNSGAEVIALHRHPLFHQPLNAPRCAFNEVGIRAYQQLSPEQRLTQLNNTPGSSYPWRLRWERQIEREMKAGRLRIQHAELTHIKSGRRIDSPLVLWTSDRTAIETDKLLFATGLDTNPRNHLLLQRMITEYALPMTGEFLQVNDDFTLPIVSKHKSVCGIMGAMARYALPVADTFAGMKYIARRLVPLLRS